MSRGNYAAALDGSFCGLSFGQILVEQVDDFVVCLADSLWKMSSDTVDLGNA